MNTPLRLLMVEDSTSDAELTYRVLQHAGYAVQHLRVQTAEAMQQALAEQVWDVIICDQKMPNFNAGAALQLLQATGLDIPFIVVSGVIGEEMGVNLMINGAQDYIIKSNLQRLVPAVQRELAEAESRRVNKRNQHALHESQARYRTFIEATADAFTRFDRAGRHLFGNGVALCAAGLTEAQYLGKTHRELGYPERVCQLIDDKLNSVFDTGLPAIVELNGNEKTPDAITELRLFPELGDDGKVISVMGVARDISEKKRSEKEIWQQANFDPLTNLANRRLFYHTLDEQIKQAKRTHVPFALLLIDLDKFKEINDVLGHAMGDKVLMSAARRMSLCLREVDMLARLGGDEFGILLTDLSALNNIERVAECILSAAAEPFLLGKEKVFISASIGIAHCPADTISAKDLFKFADQALFEAKHAGRGCYRHFSHDLDDKAEARMRITNELHDALAKHQFRIYYQPIIDLKTNSVNKAEALIRWQHPTHGLICPNDFISAAERCGSIVDMGNWVFKQSSLQQQRWREQFNPQFQVSVNLSPAQFRPVGALSKTWLEHLKTLPTDNCLAVEITESLLLDASSDVIDTLNALRNTGIKIVIDDFGTGYSSLQYLKKFGVDYLKIDQSFVADLETSPKDQALCETIIDLAHKLRIKTIAEGVETVGQRDLLTRAGCDFAQGYLFSKALPATELEDFLWSHHALTSTSTVFGGGS